MKKALFAVALFSLVSSALCADYGIDRREGGEPFLGKRLPGTLADITKDTGLPARLSQTGIFEPFKPTGELVPTRAMIPYKVNTPLWSDGAVKLRWIYVPKDAQIEIKQDNAAWLFPPGTVLVKHFDLITDETTGQKFRLETRIIVVDTGGKIYYFTYKWKDDQTDATLVPDGGDSKKFTIKTASGNRDQTWGYPARTGNDGCVRCHNTAVGKDINDVVANDGTLGVIGVKTAQLNGGMLYKPKGVTDNQLRTLRKIGLFKNAPNSWDTVENRNGTLSVQDTTVPQMAQFGKDENGNKINNTAFTIESRIRSYLDANCAHCHGGKEHEETGWDGRFTSLFQSQKIAGSRLKFTAPPAATDKNGSIYRRDSSDMPPLARELTDDQWITLVEEYVTKSFNLVNASATVLNKVTLIFDNGTPDSATAAVPGNYKLSLASDPATTIPLKASPNVNGNQITFDLDGTMDASKEYKVTVTGDVFDTKTPKNRVWPNHFVEFASPAAPRPNLDDGSAPANDNYASAAVLTGMDASDTAFNCYATKEVGEPDHANNPGGKSVWWIWTAPSTAPVRLDTLGTDFDTQLAVYTGNPVSSLTQVAVNDDADDEDLTPSVDPSDSFLRFNAIQGQIYYIAVDGFNDGYFTQCGTIQIHLHAGALPNGPLNDQFATPFVLSGLSGSVSSSNSFATSEPGELDHAGEPGGASVWWQWTASSDGQVTFDTHGSSFDTLLAVYMGGSVSNLTLVAANDDDSALFTSGVQFTAASGTTYAIAVDGYLGRTGNIRLNYTNTPAMMMILPKLQPVPAFMAPSLEDGTLRLQIDGPAGAIVEVQVSDDLVNWTTAATRTLSGATWVFADPLSPEHRYYRLARRLQ